LVGTWWSGQPKRVVDGIDGVLLLVVIGDGMVVVPVDFAVCRPNPTGPGARCRSKLGGAQGMLAESLAALHRRGRDLPAPLVVADSGFSDSKLMAHVADMPHGTVLVQGKATYTFFLAEGRKVKGAALVDEEQDWPFRQSRNARDCRYARLRAKSPTYSAVTVLIVDKPREKRLYLLCCATPLQATRLRRLWSRRHWLEQVFRTLKHLFATEACQVHSEDAYDGHLVLRLMACFVLDDTTRVIFKEQVPMEEIVFNLKHHWSSVDCQELE
jgi:hypothetical protein